MIIIAFPPNRTQVALITCCPFLQLCSEISQAQDRFTDNLESLYRTYPQYREMLRMILAAVGRGGQGDVGQRIRDEILVIQVSLFNHFHLLIC